MRLVVSVEHVDYYLECVILSLSKQVPETEPLFFWLSKALSGTDRRNLEILVGRYLFKHKTKIVDLLPPLKSYLLIPDNVILTKPMIKPFPHDETVVKYQYGIGVKSSFNHTEPILRQSTGMTWQGNLGTKQYFQVARYTIPPPYLYEMTRKFFKVPLFSDSKEPNTQPPLVSALLITRLRLDRVKVAISCFFNQSYPNKELVVICDDDEKTKAYLEQLKDSRIKLHYYTCQEIKEQFPNGVTLGGLRNLSVRLAQGEYLIQWDDDDWYHPGRISGMLSMAIKRKAQLVNLGAWILAGPEVGAYAVSGFRTEGWEGSSIFHRSVFEIAQYPETRKNEDREFHNNLVKSGRVNIFTVNDVAWAYLYIYLGHGKGTWGMKHFKKLIINGQNITDLDTINTINNLLEMTVETESETQQSWNWLGFIIFLIVILAIVIFGLIIIKKYKDYILIGTN